MNVAFIPVRGGSKSIPMKNIKTICGKPLVYWTIKAACGCHYIDKVYVATDSDKIKDTVEKFKNGEDDSLAKKTEVIGRSPESATDTASTESAMLEFAHKFDFDNIVLIQATSPLLQASDLDRGFEAFQQDKHFDSVLSVVRQKRFNWKRDSQGYAKPINYDVFHRPRRQDFDGYLVENGAFYITSKERLLSSGNRISGNIKAVEMNEDTFFEIDEPSDWVIIEALMRKNNITAAPIEIPEIKMFLADCDGCLTDGGMYYTESGDELKKFNTRDGMGFKLLQERGILTGIITGESVALNKRRADKFNLDVFVAGCRDKLEAIKKICENQQIDIRNVCYVGDDINDLEVIQTVGYGCCPSDAIQGVLRVSKYVSKAKGGKGAIREIADHILKCMKQKKK